MFKNMMIYRIAGSIATSLKTMEAALSAARFAPCGASQERSAGWVEPRGQAHGALLETVAGQHVARFCIETKAVPADAVRRLADEKAAAIEASTGRQPGRKELRDLRDDAKREMLPHAFSKRVYVWVWLDVEKGLLCLDAGAHARADAVITALVQAMPYCAPRLLNTQLTPQAAMSAWLSAGEADGGFQIERDCHLKASSEDRAVVKYARHTLDTDEIKQHIVQGKLPVKLALNWQGRVGFVLSESMALSRLVFMDSVFESAASNEADRFDADVALATGELRQLLSELIEVLGGELV